MTSEVSIIKTIEGTYGFVRDAETVDRNDAGIQEYMRAFKRDVVPEMEAIERRKTKAIELAYKIRVQGRRGFWKSASGRGLGRK